MRGLGAIAMVCFATGCIYLGEVNYAPEVTVVPESQGPYHRGDTIYLRADSSDRNASTDSPIAITWTLSAADGRELHASEAEDCSYDSPDGGCFIPHALDVVYRMTVTATDERGAKATAYRDFTLENRPPTAKLTVNGRQSANQHYLIHQVVTLSGLESTDPDAQDTCALTYEYAVVTKPLGSAAFDPVADDCGTDVAPAGCTARKPTMCYTPDVAGTYQFSVTVTDPSGASATDDVTFEVDPDGLPCLAQLVPAPIKPPGLIMAARSDGTKRFSVNVEDDLDAWPPTDTNAPGFPTFSWSLKTAGDAEPVPIPDYTSNQYELDLVAFSAGEVILVRVDMSDRFGRAPCDPGSATCPAGADPTADCVQRVTWKLQVY